MKGICPVCQSEQDVYNIWVTLALSEEDLPSERCQEEDYALCPHDNQGGEPCDGGGQNPEAVIRAAK